MAGGEGGQSFTHTVEIDRGSNQQRANLLFRHDSKGSLVIALAVDVHDPDLFADDPFCRPHLLYLKLRYGMGRIHEHRDGGRTRNELAQEPDPLGLEFRREHGDPGQIATGTVEVRHQALPDRISAAHEDDGNGCSRRLCEPVSGRAGRNHVYSTMNQIGRQYW